MPAGDTGEVGGNVCSGECLSVVRKGGKKVHVGCKREQEGKRLPGVPEGLAMAKQIISLHGGTIEVESTEGAGTTFTIRLYHS